MSVHKVICEANRKETNGSKRYFTTMMTTPHHYASVQLLRTMDQAVECSSDFIIWPDRNAKKFVAVKKTLKMVGINHTTMLAQTPESNGLVKRRKRTLLHKVRTLLKETGMTDEICGEAVKHLAYLYKCNASPALGMITRFYLIFGKPPRIFKIRVLRCEVFFHNFLVE